MDLYKIIGNNIKDEREKRGLNQVELGKEVGFNRSSISNIEKGKQKTPIHVLYEICKKLHIDIQDILPLQSEFDEIENSENQKLREEYEKHNQETSFEDFIKLFN